MAERTSRPAFWARLAREIEGDVAFDLFARGRYATDASIYQCFPAGVVCPRNAGDLAIIVEMAREEGIPLVPRGGGTSTAGQALGEGIVIDFSKHLDRIVEVDPDRLVCRVEPGVRLAALNAAAAAHGLHFPVDVASAGQATLGGMCANNSSGMRALRHGRMRDHLQAADVMLADGQRVRFQEDGTRGQGYDRLLDLLQFGELHEEAIRLLSPEGGGFALEGYDFGALLPAAMQNPARLLAGSEGTLALFTELELKLAKQPEHSALGICRFTRLGDALAAIPGIVALDPSAVLLLDRPLLTFIAAKVPSEPQAARALQGSPAAILIVEFDHENPVENTRRLKALNDCLGETGSRRFSVVEVLGQKAQSEVWRLRSEALRRAMGLSGAARPIAFLEDASIPVDALPAWAAAVQDLFATLDVEVMLHGDAGQGRLDVRPMLNLARADDRTRMRALSEGMIELLARHGGTLTAGHGLGLAKGAAFERLRGPVASRLHKELKALLDPGALLNPGKIVLGPRFDDTAILRPVSGDDTACAGLSLCLGAEASFTCPSFRVTRDERESPRGRANAVRLALSGALGEDALGSERMLDSMRLCVSCKACKTACPAAIDIPRMRARTLAAARALGRQSRAESLYAQLPHYYERARRWRRFLNLRNKLPGLAPLSERLSGVSADRPWPKWSGRPFIAPEEPEAGSAGPVALFADCFNQAFEPENLRAAASILAAAGHAVTAFAIPGAARAPCCGRTFLDTGHIGEARAEAARFAEALALATAKKIPVIGLEPACALMARDEHAAFGLTPGEPPLLLEEFIARQARAGCFALPFKPIEAELLLHTHCHERALGVGEAAPAALSLIPGLAVTAAPPSCCGLNGTVGMTPDTLEASLAMAELALFPAIRKASRDTLLVATGFSCRKQIRDGLGRAARHPAMILDLALKGGAEIAAPGADESRARAKRRSIPAPPEAS